MRHCLILSILLTGCFVELGDSGSTVEGDEAEDGDGAGGKGDNDECKIEGAQIGEDVVIQLGSKTVTFGNWVGKSDSPGEYVGFSLTLAGGSSVSYVVKSGGERAPSTALTWMHPAGADGGPDAPGISNVDFCDDPDADGGGGGDCNGGDGCPDGGGDGGGEDGPIIL